MTTHAFVRFLKEAQIIPNYLSIENIEEFMLKMLPAVIAKELEFYSKKKVVHLYEKELDGTIYKIIKIFMKIKK